MRAIDFALVGSGWRAEFFLRIAEAMPDRFRVSGIVKHREEGREAIEERWGVRTYLSLEDLVAYAAPAFVVVSVPRTASPGIIRAVSDIGLPVLCETPPAPDLEGLVALTELWRSGARIQVAEQYWLQPMHAARLALISSGLLGEVSEAQVSFAHGYHGMSLLRKYLGVGFEDAEITGKRFVSPIVMSPGRNGPPAEYGVSDSKQDLGIIDFGGKLGVFDFTGDQYFSWVRARRVLVRGLSGEICDGTVRYLVDHRTPVEMELRRMEAGQDGNLEGQGLKGIVASDEWVYRNPYKSARLSDEEVAIAELLSCMANYAAGGPDVYSFAEAAQDHYLALSLEEAITSGKPVRTTKQPWAD